MMAEQATEVQRFYANKCVFLTGGTGFLGKVFIEKILRSTEVERVYILIRAKKDKGERERIKEMFQEPLFESLLAQRKDAPKRVVPITGDCVLPNLGISPADRDELLHNVDVVVHSAATVRFDEPLATAVAINVRATVDLLRLAKDMKKLQAFVHVSSAFANCVASHIAEKFYTEKLNGQTAHEMCTMADILGVDAMNDRTKELCGEFPNTYCFTKALAEEGVRKEAGQLPVCIFRPCIVVPTYTEPLPGWVDNLYGPTTMLYGASFGVLRVLYIKGDATATLVPVDFCANAMLVSGWSTAQQPHRQNNQAPKVDPAIYNLVPEERNKVQWAGYINTMRTHGVKMPLEHMVWYPLVRHTNSKFLYKLLCLLYHTIPGYFADFVLLLLGKKRRMVRTYQKIHRQTNVVKYFLDNSWTFETTSTRALLASMSPADRRLFPFDMNAIDWSQYFYNSLWGMRRFLAKEDPSTIPKGLKLLSRFMVLHYSLEAAFVGGGLFLVAWTFLRICDLQLKSISH